MLLPPHFHSTQFMHNAIGLFNSYMPLTNNIYKFTTLNYGLEFTLLINIHVK